MLDGLKIKCIGFSVTEYGNPPYPTAIENLFRRNGNSVEVSYSSVGGLSIDALPYLLKLFVKKNEVDIVILEIATSWFSNIRIHQEEADGYIKLIINYLESINVKIIFLNLYRKDTDDNDTVVQAIRSLANGKYPILDFKSYYRKQFMELGDDGTTDGVHPKPEVIEHFSAKICEFISSNFSELKVSSAELQNPSYFDLVKLNPLQDKEHFFDNRHGLILSTTILSQGEVIEMQLTEKKRISGIFFTFGPDTNHTNLSLDGELINIPMRDEMSFYRRIGYRYLGVRDVQHIKVEHPIGLMQVKLAREPWEAVDKLQNYIIGFSSGI